MADIHGTVFPEPEDEIVALDIVAGTEPKVLLNLGHLSVCLSEAQAREVMFQVGATLRSIEHDRDADRLTEAAEAFDE